MLKNLMRTLCILIILISIASAITIDNPNMVFQITNTNISFPTNQTFTSIDISSNYISINSKILQLTPSVQTTIKINSFNTAGDSYNISVSGASSGTLTITQQVLSSNKTYNFFKNGTYNFAVDSNSTSWITKTIDITTNEDTYTWPEAVSSGSGGGSGGGVVATPTPTPNITATPSPIIFSLPRIIIPEIVPPIVLPPTMEFPQIPQSFGDVIIEVIKDVDQIIKLVSDIVITTKNWLLLILFIYIGCAIVLSYSDSKSVLIDTLLYGTMGVVTERLLDILFKFDSYLQHPILTIIAYLVIGAIFGIIAISMTDNTKPRDGSDYLFQVVQ